MAIAFRIARYANDEEFKEFVSVKEDKPTIEDDLISF